MDYWKIAEVADRWGISSRRVQTLCAAGKIEGAVRFGRDWMIPKGTAQPIDGRTKAGRAQAAVHLNMDMPLPRKTPFLYMTDLYETDHTFNIAGKTPEEKTNVDGAFTFETITYAETGTYFYAIVEDAANPLEGIVYDRTQHNYIVQVSDIGDGQLKATVTDADTGISTPAGAAVTANAAFTNATFDEAVEKEVYHADNTTTHIDGQKVEAGDKLTYFITYSNYTGQTVVADIMDTIPNHTTYVEGSASHGGTYAGEHVNWILNVGKGESVTVSFTVVVDEAKATIVNTAVVRDGVNTYTTNKVTNEVEFVSEEPTEPVEPTVPQESTAPQEPTAPGKPAEPAQKPIAPSKPVTPAPGNAQTGDNFQGVTFITLMVLSSFGLAAVMVCKKREQDKENTE